MIVCRNMCMEGLTTQEVKLAMKNKSSPYEYGYVYCTICEKWFIRGIVKCPCCKCVLRTKPRASRLKRRMESKGLISRVEVDENEQQ